MRNRRIALMVASVVLLAACSGDPRSETALLARAEAYNQAVINIDAATVIAMSDCESNEARIQEALVFLSSIGMGEVLQNVTFEVEAIDDDTAIVLMQFAEENGVVVEETQERWVFTDGQWKTGACL